MSPPLPTPSTEPMLYFLSNSLAVVAAAGVLFFVLGLWFGFLTWGRYKRRARAFQEETSLLRHEIASLKRRIAAEAVEPSRPVSIIDEGPSVELQPLLFQMMGALANQGPPPDKATMEPSDIIPIPGQPVTTASMIASAKANTAVTASLPEAVGSDGREMSAVPVPANKPASILPPPVEVPVPTPPAPSVPEAKEKGEPPSPSAEKPAIAPPPAVASSDKALPVPGPVKNDGPVVSLASAEGPMPANLLSGLSSSTSNEGPSTSQMNASLHVTHDAGLPEFPALPGLGEALATTQIPLPEQRATPPRKVDPPSAPAVRQTSPDLPPVSIRPLQPLPPPVEFKALKPVPPVPSDASKASHGAGSGRNGTTSFSGPPDPSPFSDSVQWFAKEVEGGLGVEDPELGFCYTHRPERWDDLTLLRGLGDALQERLHESGIYTFKQIALWTEEQSAEAGHRIHAHERVQRERWVQQATDLHFLKYGERVRGEETPHK